MLACERLAPVPLAERLHKPLTDLVRRGSSGVRSPCRLRMTGGCCKAGLSKPSTTHLSLRRGGTEARPA